AFSAITHASPTVIVEPSASRIAPYMIRARGPTRTSPTRVALGATNAEGSTLGVDPRWLISIHGSVLGGRGHAIAISAGEPVIAYPHPPRTRPALGRAPGRRRRAGGGMPVPCSGGSQVAVAVLAGTLIATGLEVVSGG